MTAVGSRAPNRPGPTRRAVKGQPRGDRTRQLIIDETIRCVREEGFAAASANHIAERAGVTWGVIQYHFGDRDAVLMAVVDHGFDLVTNAIQSVDAPTGSIRDRVQAVVDAGWQAFSHPASLAALEILVATRDAREARHEEHLAEIADRLTFLGHAVDSGRSNRRRQSVGEVLWAALRGFALAQMVVREPIDFSHQRQVLIELLATHLESTTR